MFRPHRLPFALSRPLPNSLRRYAAAATNPPFNDPLPTTTTTATLPSSPPNISETNATPVSTLGMRDLPLQEDVAEGEARRQMQAPNRAGVWSRSQQEREVAMRGPRFEQTIMEFQPRPQAAIELIHKQPVHWTRSRVVSCDGGGGALGHPRIFINVDKPQINTCTYCGLPFAHERHRAHLQSLASTAYPLEPTGHPAEVAEPQRVTDEAFAQR